LTIGSGSQSLVEIAKNAILIGRTTALRATTSEMNLYAEDRGYGAGFWGESDDSSSVNVSAHNEVLIDDGVNVTGNDGVGLQATFAGVDTYAYSFARVTGLFGHLSSSADNTTTLNSEVVADPRTNSADPRAQITAGPRNDDYTFTNSGTHEVHAGDTVRFADGRQYQYLGSTANIDLGAADYSNTNLWKLDNLRHPTDLTAGAAALDHLALFVATTNQINRIDRNADYSKRALASGGSHGDTNNNQARTVTWNADVHIFSGQSPELEIDANGVITKAGNVDVNDSATAGESATKKSGLIKSGTIVVNNITNDDPGQAYFDDSGDASGSGSVSISGSGGSWDFSDTFRQVLITNHSSKTLKINNIDVVNTTVNPLVDLNGKSVPLTFAL